VETTERLAPSPVTAGQPRDARATRVDPAARAGTSARGDPAAFEAAVRPHYAPLVRRLVVVLGDEHDAEDVAQDAYLRAFRSWDHFDGTDVRAWLYTIALRLAFNQLRRRRRWLGILGGSRLGRADPAPWTDRSDPDLWAALGGLDGRTRAALLLNVLDGYTHREIAAMFDVPEGTVASWISRGRSALRAELGPDR
jgi:RNA polymerase sigma-70 factor (ECF subfamily)